MKYIFSLFFSIFFILSKGQIAFDEKFRLLGNNSQTIQNNDTLNEKIVDLVEANLIDSLLPLNKKPHHRVFLLGWAIHALGNYNWRYTHPVKGKLVGTVIRQSRSGEEVFTEFDINHDVVFHLDKYLHKSFEMYDMQAKTKRQDFRPNHRTDYSNPPYVRDKNNKHDIKMYKIHSEYTPPRKFRHTLDQLFYPVIRPNEMRTHYNFMDNSPTVGMYGAFCMDCNHNCHPEMHPYEWLWWLNLSKKDPDPNNKEWLIGLMKEGSNRFKEWVKGPRTGTIKIPFYFQLANNTDTPTLLLSHILTDKFNLEVLNKNFDSSIKTLSTKQTLHTISFNENYAPLQVRFNIPLIVDGVKVWIEQGQFDNDTKSLAGYLCLFTSVESVYNARLNTYVVKANEVSQQDK